MEGRVSIDPDNLPTSKKLSASLNVMLFVTGGVGEGRVGWGDGVDGLSVIMAGWRVFF